MLRQLRALFHHQSPLPYDLHYHVDDRGRQVPCDESACRPAVPAAMSPLLWRRF